MERKLDLTIDLRLSPDLAQFVEQQVQRQHYPSARDYILDLIRGDLYSADPENLEELILEGIQSGEAREMTQQDWDELHQRLHEKHKARSA